jgi:6-carboxyhexanoate--CoA ligase
MRASRLLKKLDSDNDNTKELHISGAEGIYEDNEIKTAINRYFKRAMSHSRGQPDKIFFTLEKIGDDLIKVPILSLTTLQSSSPKQARELIIERLSRLGINEAAIYVAFEILYSSDVMRGAALIGMTTGSCFQPDKSRGIRVSRLGIDKESRKKLSNKLARLGIDTDRVKEALILASKVAYHEDVVAELCISDDPEYTIGYIATSGDGYLRIPNIKTHGSMNGGRVFFIKEESNVSSLIKYLEKTPVLIYFHS